MSTDLSSLAPAEKREVEQLLKELEQVRERNPLQFYQPHPKQVLFHEGRERIRSFMGGNRSGKSTAGILDNLIQTVDQKYLPAHLKGFKRWEPPFYCRIITPDLTRTMDGVILQKLREWCPKDLLTDGSVDKSFDSKMRVVRFTNGSYWELMSTEQDLNKMGGTALHRVHFDEEPPLSVWSENWVRLTDYEGDALLTMTPLLGLSWTYHGIFKRQDDPDILVVTVDIDDNPHISEKGRRNAFAGMSKEERQARKEGRFVHFAGLVFPDFNPNTHVVPEPDEINPEFVHIVGIDPGIRHMAAVVWVQFDYDDNAVVFDELAVQGGTVGDVALAIHGINKKWAVQPRWYVIDPSARNKYHQTGRSDQMEFMDHGIVTIAGQNSVTAGINRVNERLQNQRLQISQGCPTLIAQMQEYRWATPQRAQRDVPDPPEKPVKRNDHMCDSLRYVLMSRPFSPDRPSDGRETEMQRVLREDMSRVETHDSGFGDVFA